MGRCKYMGVYTVQGRSQDFRNGGARVPRARAKIW